MLCDDVGLGKSVQVLGLVLARPPPAGWSAPHPLPRATKAVLPVKASLLVAPAALLPQWEAELHKHTVQGALRSATYVGVGSAPPPPSPPEGEEEEEEESVAAEGERQVRRPKRSRSSVSRYQPGGVSAAAAPAGEADGGEEEAVEVLASTRPGLFVCGAGEACAVEECDVVFCSFETLRDELKVVGRGGRGGGIGGGSARGGAGGGGGMGASPLGTLGFWRIVLDEAQVVSNSASAAAVMASALWRRQAWVVTGTPVNSRLAELQGLLAFLDARPFSEPASFNALVHHAFERRADEAALLRMRTLLSAHLLRRTKADPAVAKQLRLPPVEWVTVGIELEVAERAAYDAALADLRASHGAFARVVEAAAGARGAQRRLDEARRRRGLDARDFESAGAFSSLVQARKMGELNGTLTRVRQMLCSPFAVNAEKVVGGLGKGEAAVLASATRLPQRTILERLVAQASRDRDNAAVAHLRARAALYVAHVALAPHTLEAEAEEDPGSEFGAVAAETAEAAEAEEEEAADAEAPVASAKARGKRKAAGVAGGSTRVGKGKAGGKTKAGKAKPPAPRGPLAGLHGQEKVLAELDDLVARSKERCAAASSDEAVQRILEVRRQCAKCQRTPGTALKSAAAAAAAASEAAASEAASEAAGASVAAAVAEEAVCGGGGGGEGGEKGNGVGEACAEAGGACSKGGSHAFRVVAPRRWAVLRAALKKLYLGKDAPWDVDDEREAKAAAAAERRKVVQDADGKVVKSRRQGRKDAQSEAAAAAAAAASAAPDGWGRPAKRHPALAAIFTAWRRSGVDAALREGAAAVEGTARVLREKKSNESFLQAKLDRYDHGAAGAAGGGVGGGVGGAEDGAEAEAEGAAAAAQVVALEAETCPICFDDRGDGAWVVTPCGHAGCYECILQWVEERVTCPVCKQGGLTAGTLFEVEPAPPPPPPEAAAAGSGVGRQPGSFGSSGAGGAAGTSSASASSASASSASPGGCGVPLGRALDKSLVREYGSKIAALHEVVAAAVERGEKVVVFSAWTRLLKLAADALASAGIACASLVGSAAAKQEALRRFGAAGGLPLAAADGDVSRDAAAAGASGAGAGSCDALLVPLFGGASGAGGSGAAGLNLQVASVAVLLEPSLQPGIEAQAVGRICRLGQERATKVVRLIVQESIEPNILLWQSRRLARGAVSASGHAPLGLSDFVHVLGSGRSRGGGGARAA